MRINKSLITFTPSSGAGSGSVTSVAMSVPTGFVVSGSPITSSGTLAVTFAAGYALPTTAKQTQWDSAYSFTSTFPTGSAGQLLRYNTLGTALEFFTPSYLTSINATTPLVYNSGTNTISIPAASSSVNGYLTSADWLTFSSKQPAITLTTTGNSGSATFNGITGALNIPTYTLAGLGGLSNPFSAALGQIIYSNSAGAALSLAGNTTTTKMFLSSTGDGTNASAPVWEAISASSLGVVPTSRTLTINGTSYDLSANRSWSVGTVTSVDLSVPTGLSVSGNPITSSGTLAISLQSGYSIPTTAKQTEWDSAYTNRITNLTTTGSSGSATLVSNTLNIPTYTLAGLGGMSNPMTSLGDMIYGNAAGAALRRSGNTTTTKMFLSQTGDGTSSAAPQWSVVTASDTGSVPTSRTLTINDVVFDLSANRSWSVGDYGTW